jgi:hypothetical protein
MIEEGARAQTLAFRRSLVHAARICQISGKRCIKTTGSACGRVVRMRVREYGRAYVNLYVPTTGSWSGVVYMGCSWEYWRSVLPAGM